VFIQRSNKLLSRPELNYRCPGFSRQNRLHVALKKAGMLFTGRQKDKHFSARALGIDLRVEHQIIRLMVLLPALSSQPNLTVSSIQEPPERNV
jgi:hypothetical protein